MSEKSDSYKRVKFERLRFCRHFCTAVIALTILRGPEGIQSCINRGHMLLRITSYNVSAVIYMSS